MATFLVNKEVIEGPASTEGYFSTANLQLLSFYALRVIKDPPSAPPMAKLTSGHDLCGGIRRIIPSLKIHGCSYEQLIHFGEEIKKPVQNSRRVTLVLT